MHPAYSVIIFTTSAGAGYGLLAWLALTALGADYMPTGVATGVTGFAIGLILVTAGLLSSTLHLGRPERAWRAFSQWQTSWLSREGVLAVIGYPVIGLLGLYWIFQSTSALMSLLAIVAIAIIAAILWCTGMIYASLPTIRAWSTPLTAPLYVVLGLATGGVIHNLLAAIFDGAVPASAATLAVVLLAAGYIMKTSYWTTIDGAARTHTAEAATGLGRFGKVRPLDPPHTQANYIMREMGFEVARKHGLRLRKLCLVALFAVPVACQLLALLVPGWLGVALLAIAVISAGAGVMVERWLFFAEAEHVVMLYYGRSAA